MPPAEPGTGGPGAMFRRIDDRVIVAGQIAAEDVAQAAEAGVRTIVNNRPDGEEPGQPAGADIEAAANAAGLDYVAIPIGASGLSVEKAGALREVIAAGAPILAFCRSGTRSTYLWAAAEALAGGDHGEIATKANAAGYDVRGLLASLR